MKTIPFLFLAGIILITIQCSDNPQLVFPEDEQIARITGYISPKGVTATVYILDAIIIDSAVTDSATGYFQFVNVPYGSYLLKVVAQGYGIITEPLYVNASYVNMHTLRLKDYPSQIHSITPENNSIVKAGNVSFFTDTTAVIRITFKERMDTVSVKDAFSVTPAISWRIAKTEFSEPYHSMYIAMPIIDFFTYPEITITLEQSAKTVYGEHLDFDLALKYYPDTASLSEVITYTYIISTVPYNSQTDVNAATDIKIRFRTPMNRVSVEQAFSLSPTATPNFFWSIYTNYEELTVKFAIPLRNNTVYTVTLDTGMTTFDSTVIPGSLSFSFTTRSMQFIDYSPLDGEPSFPATDPFRYTLNFLVDPADFLNAFSIAPPVDSLSLSITLSPTSGYYDVTVYHSLLKLDTTYTVTIDSTLKAIGGAALGTIFTQTFTTESILSDTTSQIDSSLISSVVPSDTTHLINCSGEPRIYFRYSMDKQSVEQRISLTPATLFTVSWQDYLQSEDRIVNINPSQRLKANTLYTVVIDSGYQTKAETVGNRYTFSFKTEPITLMEYEPLNGQVNVPASNPIRLKFNTALDTSSLLTNIVIVPSLDSTGISYTGVMDDNAWYYISHKAFLPDTTYTVTLQESITDLFGVLLGRSYTISFTTGN